MDVRIGQGYYNGIISRICRGCGVITSGVLDYIYEDKMKIYQRVAIEIKTYPVSRSGYSQVTPAFVECQHEAKIHKHNFRKKTKSAYCKAKRILYVAEFKE